ncbi:MAG: ABC transporter permease [Anaerolineaceae bacterium]|nr:ABC transporter permease [Anaerolineaceae bacterium]
MAIRWLRLVFFQMSVQFRLRALSWWSLLLLLIQPAVFSTVGFVLARIAGRSAPDLVYTIIGGGVMGLWSSLLFTSFFDITRDRREGTLELIVGSPTSLSAILAIRTMANVLTGFLSLMASFLVAEVWFHYSIPFANVPWILGSIVVLLFSFWTVGLFLANFHAWSRLSGTAVNYIELPIAVICGFMFPVGVLPAWLQVLSYGLPLRWAVRALNSSLATAIPFRELTISWIAALSLACLFWVASCWLTNLVHDRIRTIGGMAAV